MRKSELIAAESVACLNKALCHLKDIWEEIGIPEDQRLERTNVVKNHVKSLLDMMILEKKLKAEIEQWEHEQNREFQVNGQKFMQFVTDQWETYRLEKEREKQERQLKKSKQTEEDMVYGTVIRTPTKRRFLGSTTPCKARKLNATSSTGTSNSTIRSVFGGTVCHSPISRPPISESKGNVKTPGHSKPPHQGLLECNKENISHLTGGVAGMTKVPASPQRNFSINSVASTYSEFQRDLSKSSKSKHVLEILNSTIIQL
ncbi:protein regulator of cytokinesis 1-like [Sinocyclocheilus grahami]|uniref:protein regulator of cytokinesis 1-like n=1 Tax=Sinocyclocheilus grahami TaxID=75366 RepID=UPI0007AD064F|nr:PREDICTED: protein regulator of cytokinesis 1-like [Sinocyclocheilus grahami]